MENADQYKNDFAADLYRFKTSAAEKYLSELMPRLAKFECDNPDAEVFLQELQFINSYSDGSGIEWLDLRDLYHSLGMSLRLPDVVSKIRNSRSRAIFKFLLKSIDKYREFVEISEFVELVDSANQYYISALDFPGGAQQSDATGLEQTLKFAKEVAEHDFPKSSRRRLSALIQLIEVISRSAINTPVIVIDVEGFCQWWNSKPKKTKGHSDTYKISAEELIFIINRLTSIPRDERRKHFIDEISNKTNVEFAGKNIWQNLSRNKNGAASEFLDPNFEWSIRKSCHNRK